MFNRTYGVTPGVVLESPDGRFGGANNPEDNSSSLLPELYRFAGEGKENSLKTRFYAQMLPLKGQTLKASYVFIPTQ